MFCVIVQRTGASVVEMGIGKKMLAFDNIQVHHIIVSIALQNGVAYTSSEKF